MEILVHCKKMLNELSHFRGPLQAAARSCEGATMIEVMRL